MYRVFDKNRSGIDAAELAIMMNLVLEKMKHKDRITLDDSVEMMKDFITYDSSRERWTYDDFKAAVKNENYGSLK